MSDTVLTKRDLIERGVDALDSDELDRTPVIQKPAQAAISRIDLGAAVTFAKAMAASGAGVPPHVRGNVGICLKLVCKAHEWNMSPYSLADATYIVNDRLGYFASVIHAAIEEHGNLRGMLECDYEGEVVFEEVEQEDGSYNRIINFKKSTRVCIVTGAFRNGAVRFYKSPMLMDIKVRNSPLWVNDTDQQLWYFSVRAFGRKWCANVMHGVYTRDELRDDPNIGLEENEMIEQGLREQGLRERLAGRRSGEGFRPDRTNRELSQLAAGTIIEGDSTVQSNSTVQAESSKTATEAAGKPEAPKAAETPATPKDEQAATAARRGPNPEAIKAAADRAEQRATKEATKDKPKPAAPKPPQTIKQYIAYATDWISKSDEVVPMAMRYSEERKLRNALGMTAEDRAPLDALIAKRKKELSG